MDRSQKEVGTAVIAVPGMVTLVREAKGWTQADLASAADLSQGYVSKVENGLLDLSGERLTLVAEALGCPVQLLVEREAVRQVEVTCLHHRRRQSKMTVAAMKRIEAVAHLSRLTAEGLLGPFAAAGLKLPERNSHQRPAEAAQDVRRRWDLPAGPIRHVIRTLEQAGVVVIVRDLGTTTQDAVSIWPPGESQLPMMLINTGFPPDRQRFTACHELGHLLLHQFPAEEQEQEANQFAAEFLVPAAEIRPHLEGLQTHDFKRLMELKEIWGVSIGMLIQRAWDLDCISDRQFKEFRIRLGRMGWNTSEPVDLEAEHPTLIADTIRGRIGAGEASLEQLAQQALMTPEAFVRHYCVSDDVTTLSVGSRSAE